MRPTTRAGTCRSSRPDRRGRPRKAARCRRRGTPRPRPNDRQAPPRRATAGQPGRAHAKRSTDGRRLRPRPGVPAPDRARQENPLVRQDLVEQCLGLVLVGLLGERELADQDLPCLREHALLARGQAAFLVPAPQVPDDLGDLVHVAGGKLLQVGLVPPGPVRRLLGVRGTEQLEDALEPFGAYDITNTY